MSRIHGVRIVAETEGTGSRAEKGDVVLFDCATCLNRGSDIHGRRTERIRLGSRRLIAGIEAALVGMREGEYRKVRISPHLAYRGSGVGGIVPRNAVLVCELWLNAIEQRRQTRRAGIPKAVGLMKAAGNKPD